MAQSRPTCSRPVGGDFAGGRQRAGNDTRCALVHHRASGDTRCVCVRLSFRTTPPHGCADDQAFPGIKHFRGAPCQAFPGQRSTHPQSLPKSGVLRRTCSHGHAVTRAFTRSGWAVGRVVEPVERAVGLSGRHAARDITASVESCAPLAASAARATDTVCGYSPPPPTPSGCSRHLAWPPRRRADAASSDLRPCAVSRAQRYGGCARTSTASARRRTCTAHGIECQTWPIVGQIRAAWGGAPTLAEVCQCRTKLGQIHIDQIGTCVD